MFAYTDVCEACTHCPRCGRRYCRDEEPRCPDCDVPCGRLDTHDEHEWTGKQPWPYPRTFLCPGEVVIEGGHFGGAA